MFRKEGPFAVICRDFTRFHPSSSLFLSSSQAKCHQYWPEAGSVSFGDLTVTILEVQELAYYTIRTFRMQKVQMTSV